MQNFKHALYSIMYSFQRLIRRCYSLVCKPQKAIVFESFFGKQYSDNPRAISEKMHELYPDYRIYWAFVSIDKNPYGLIPDYVKRIPRNSLLYYKTVASSTAYVTNTALEMDFYKRKDLFVVQTWHGDISPKKVLHDAWETGERPFPVMDNQYTNLCIAGSPLGEKVFRTSFRYSGRILNVGMPRNDRLFLHKHEDISLIKNRLGIPLGYKIILYAPTFKDNFSGKPEIEIDLIKTLTAVNSREGEWICLLRGHSLTKGFDNHQIGDNVYDVSNYPDMADILLITDILITDYSSSAGDFLLQKKPVILTLFDKNYEKNRSLAFDVEDAGFIVAHTQEELNDILISYSDKEFIDNCNELIKHFQINENGKASEIVCKEINDHYTNCSSK